MPIDDLHVHIQQEPEQPRVDEGTDRQQKTEVAEEKPQIGKTQNGHEVKIMTKAMTETDKSTLIGKAQTKLDSVAEELGLKKSTFVLGEGGEVLVSKRKLTVDLGAQAAAGKTTLMNKKTSLEAEKGRLTKLEGSLKGNPMDDPKTKASQDKITTRMNEINQALTELEPQLAKATKALTMLDDIKSLYNESIKGEKKAEKPVTEHVEDQVDVSTFSGTQSTDSVSKGKVEERTTTAEAPSTPTTQAAPKKEVKFADELGKELKEEHSYVKGSAPNASVSKGAEQLKNLSDRAPISSSSAPSKPIETAAANEALGASASKPSETVNSTVNSSKSSETDKANETSSAGITQMPDRAKDQFNRITGEICQTEKDFAGDVQKLSKGLEGIIKAAYPKGGSEEISKTFLERRLAEVKQLETVGKELGLQFQEANKGTEMEKAAKLAKVYQSPAFQMYMKISGSYSANFEALQSQISSLAKSDKSVAKALSEFQLDPNNRGLDMGSMSIKPVQRFMKHPLLLRDLEKQTPQGAELNGLFAAHKKVEGMISQINELTRNTADSNSLEKISQGPTLSDKEYSKLVLDQLETNKISNTKIAENFFQVLGSKAKDPESRIQGLKLVMQELKNMGVISGSDDAVKKQEDNADKADKIRAVLASNPGILRGLHAEIAALDKPAIDKGKEKFLGFLSLGNVQKSESMLKDLSDLRAECRLLEDQAEGIMRQQRTAQRDAKAA